MTVVRELVTFLGYEVDDAALKKAQAEFEGLRSLAKSVVLAVGAVTGALAGLAYTTAEYADDISKASQALGISAKTLQQLEYAASTARVEAQGLRSVLRDLQKNAAEASTGNVELATSFYRLGVNVRGANGKIKPADVLFAEVGAKLAKMPDASRRTQLALKLLGGEGAKLLPLFTRGADGLAKARAEAESLGLVLGDDALASGEAFSQELSQMRYELAALGRSIGAEVIPPARELLAWARKMVRGQRDVIRSSAKKTIEALGKALAIGAEFARRFLLPLLALGKALGGVETFAKIAALALGGLFLVKLGKGILAMQAAIKAGKGLAVTIKMLGLAPAFAAIKWLALAAIIGLVIDDVLTFARGGNSVLGKMLEHFTKPILPDDTWPIVVMKSLIQLITTASEKLAKMLGLLKEDVTIDVTGTELRKHNQRVTRIRAPRAGELPTSTPGMRKASGGLSGEAVYRLGAEGLGPVPGDGMRLSGPDGSDLAARNLGSSGSSTITIQAPVRVEVDASGVNDAGAVGSQVGGAVGAAVEAGMLRAFERAKLSQGTRKR